MRESLSTDSKQNNYVPPHLRQRQETTVASFSSSDLAGGSDKIVFITNGERISKTVWKKKLSSDDPLNQDDVKIFIYSALVTIDSQIDYEVENLVTKLGNPESGIKKLKDIMNFPMSCDAGSDCRVLSFQRVILPLLGLFTRTAITGCDFDLESHVNAIFIVVYANLDSFLYNNVMKMLETLVQRNSIVDRVQDLSLRERYSFIPSSLGIFFLIIVRLLTELLRRINDASINKTIHKVAHDLQQLKIKYKQSIEQEQSFSNSTDPLINNSGTRSHFFIILEEEIDTMNKMLNNNGLTFKKYSESDDLTAQLRNKELVRKANAKRFYDPLGELSERGKRHDNDFVEISQISIIPTKEEILSDRQRFLPSPLPDAPHFLQDGMNKLLDIQFRLLREDMLSTIRSGILGFLAALSNDRTYSSSANGCELTRELRRAREIGRFRYKNGTNNDGDLQVYTNIQFVDITCDRRKGFSCTLKFTPPNIRNARNVASRKEYWKKCKKLLVGSLVTLLLPNSERERSNNSDSDFYSLYFGTVILRNEDDLSRYDDYSEIGVNFIDPSIYPIALKEISNFNRITKGTLVDRFLVESTSVYLESYYHVLKTLQTVNPSTIPFEKYLAFDFDQTDCIIDYPRYTKVPRFQFDLSVLCEDEKQNLMLSVAETNRTHDEVAKNITKYRAKALVFALTREIALIQGPPGTGKTVVGIEIMKVLLAKKNKRNNIGPILAVCFTNHALDQFLEHLLDEGITNIVRLGFQSKSDRIKGFNLEDHLNNERERERKRDHLDWQISHLHRSLDEIEDEIDLIKNLSSGKSLTWNDMQKYLMTNEPKFYDKFIEVSNDDIPDWVLGTNEDPSWKQQKNRKKKRGLSIFDKWVKGEDIKIINNRKLVQIQQKNDNKKGDKNENDKTEIDIKTIQWIENYIEPKTDRSLSELLFSSDSIWKMSNVERGKLYIYWSKRIYEEFLEKSLGLSGLQREYEEKIKKMNELYNERRCQILLKRDVIGVTTSGAAKFQDLIRSVRSKIIICEEAGEVLEAHILSVLTESTEHLILIGDHNQLRPHISSYDLRMDSPTGRNYQLDKSLFERLTFKIEKTQLLTQRRMRKNEISDLIRHTIYPDLVDGENTANYPNVHGAQHNVYFIDHRHPEDGDSTTQSHVNTYEVKMVVEMVKYFVRNGYTKPDDIAVITPYLAQMFKIKEALSESLAVVIDERDEQNIVEMEEQEDKENKNNKKGKSNVASKKLNHQVTLRTVDNFQGEEANIVIISLVRNFSKSGGSIGFLKSSNRTNVLLSRAREGMYLIGNSELMAMKSNDMWAPIINILRTRNPPQIGFGMPIVCNKHSNYKHIIVDPERFEQVSPDGGCFESCHESLPCGHKCTYKCHSGDHVGIKCNKPCIRLHRECNHPCPKLCYENCGECNFPFGNVTLHCGHVLKDAKCQQNKTKVAIKCMTLVIKKLPYCEHTKTVHCFESVDNVECRETCKKRMKCGHECLNVCFKCQENYTDEETTSHHVGIKCNEPCIKLHQECNHQCPKLCYENCGECDLPIGDITLPGCGHVFKDAKCYQNKTKETVECMTLVAKKLSYCGHTKITHCFESADNIECEEKLECGHKCLNERFKCQDKCMALVEKKLPYCEHSKIVHCFESVDNVMCEGICKKQMKCGHECLNECSKCQENHTQSKDETTPIERTQPGRCTNICNKLFFCGHRCKQYCYDCHEVNKKCIVSCHNRCSESYAVYATKCSWKCKNKGKCEYDPCKYDYLLKEIGSRIIFLKDEAEARRNKLKIKIPKIKRRVVLFEEFDVTNEEITPCQYFTNIGKYHGFNEASEQAWITHVGKLLNCYDSLTSIIYSTKIHAFLDSNSESSQLTLDRRIHLDTFFEIINVQKILYRETLFIVEEMHKEFRWFRNIESYYRNFRDDWKNFAERLQRSIKQHLDKIKEVAAESICYDRHLSIVSIEILEFDLKILRYQLKYPPKNVIDQTLQESIIKKCEDIKKSIIDIYNSRFNNAKGEFRGHIYERLKNLWEKCNEVETCAKNLDIFKY